MFNQQIVHPGSLIAERFLLKEQIGAGRMSFVYRAEDRAASDARVAVKVIHTERDYDFNRAVFKRETAVLKRLSHQNIVGLRYSGKLDREGAYFLVLDYQPYSLDRYLAGDSGHQMITFEPYRVMRELAMALAYAHSQDVVHRDIKPSNILLDADGRPYLTDFGISKLVDHLTVGQTLSGFWSLGYASPEQRASEPVDFKSDIYSLGAVFFQILTGEIPPPEGPTPEMAEKLANERLQIRNVLKRMLAELPEERDTGPQLVAALENITRQVESLPKHFLILPGPAIGYLREAGYIASDDFNAAAECIEEHLGGPSRREVYVRQDRNDRSTIRILGDSIRLICRPDRDEPSALAIVAVHAPYQPDLDREKEQAMQYRATWESVPSSRSTVANSSLQHLIGLLDKFESATVVEQSSRRSRRDFIEYWRTALVLQEQQIAAYGFLYESVVETDGQLRFTLSDPPPDDLNWPEEAPLAVEIPEQGREPRSLPIGNLIEIIGSSVAVAKDNRQFRGRQNNIPSAGRIMLNPLEVRSAIRRQLNAIMKFRDGDATNPKLADVIVESAATTRMPQPELEYFQEFLSDDKREAVSKAISSNELFLIQGPPGTGKTAVIAEIVLQILKGNPEARILLSSQSNVAVDHALTQIAVAAREHPPAMIRLGRPEKISGEDWTVLGRSEELRQEVQEKCSAVLDELKIEEGNIRAVARKQDEAITSSDAADGSVGLWIAETREWVKELREYERQAEMLQRRRGAGSLRALAADRVEEARTRLKGQLDALANLLSVPIEYTGENADDVLDEIVRASAPRQSVEPDLTEIDIHLHRIRGVRNVLQEWMQVAGRTTDMMRLIVDQSNIVAATCLYSGGRYMPDATFDWAIIDEAGRATVPEVLIPIVKSERAILVGDERQLPPMVENVQFEVTTDSPDDYPLDTSLFQILVEQAEEADYQHVADLRRQYRMHPAIGNLISQVFYEGKLEQGRVAGHSPVYDWLPKPVSWLSTSALPNRGESRRGQSFANHVEAELIVKWLEDCEERCRQRGIKPTVGVISGYQAQVEQLVRLLDPDNHARWQSLRMEIATVDSFQGRECDVVLYSTVRSNLERRIGFLRDYRRINVALSRARDLLVIVGDDFMMRAAAVGTEENPFAAVLEHMRRHPDECDVSQISQRG